jgi:hypothetical protein
MERSSDSMKQIEDRVFGLLSEPLATGGPFRFDKDGTVVSVWIRDETTGQNIAVHTKNEHDEQDSASISVIHSADKDQRPSVTAMLTKGFGSSEPSYLYYPDSDMGNNLGIANLNMLIELAIEAQTRSPEQRLYI